MSNDPIHWALAAGLFIAWFFASWFWLRKHRGSSAPGAQTLVVFASQTGHGEDIARDTHRRIVEAGASAVLLSFDQLTAAHVAAADQLYLIASTTGHGDAPDNAQGFATRMSEREFDLAAKRVAILALGDRRYADFCRFGTNTKEWAERCGALSPVQFVTVDDLAAEDLARWDGLLDDAGYPAVADPAAIPQPVWHLGARQQVAKAVCDAHGEQTSDGLYRVTLRLAGGGKPQWQIGDLFELRTQDGHLRSYSIANRPGAEELVLFVRRVMDGGIVGRGSGMLTGTPIGIEEVVGRIREHRSFRPPSGDGPVLAIGAGSGWAGLRPHILDAMATGRRCRLIFGERANSACDELFAEMQGWLAEGKLHGLDLVRSRGGGPYVQHLLAERTEDIRQFLGAEGCVILCGRSAMGEASLDTLSAIMGSDWVERAKREERLRSDLY